MISECHLFFQHLKNWKTLHRKAINLIFTQWGLCQHVTGESGNFTVFDLILQEHLVYSDRIPVLSFQTNSFQHFFLLIHCSHSILLSFSCAHSQVTLDNIHCLKMPFFNPRNWLWKAWFQRKSLPLLKLKWPILTFSLQTHFFPLTLPPPPC
jgi:hypothetical protein